jgi:hypothetical protein
MGFIGLYFLSATYSIPPFIIVSLFTSALLLGMKIAAVTTLPYWFGKLTKWKANRPAGASRNIPPQDRTPTRPAWPIRQLLD